MARLHKDHRHLPGDHRRRWRGKPLPRRGKPSIKEQLRILRLAADQRADVLVIECMAVLPEYQKTSEEAMLRADLGVITNVRLDHPEEMGETLDEIANALSHTIPERGILFTADAAYHEFFTDKAREKGTSVVLSNDADLSADGIDFAENVALALAVCAHPGCRATRRWPACASTAATPARSA